ncbi:MAG: glutathione S-transferase family protein [Hyphomicrobiaceae bacterium]
MLELHTWGTTNGRRPIIMLEEASLSYSLHPVDIKSGANKSEAHLKISPYGKIPALVDTAGPGGQRISLFESSAILLYLGERSGKFMGDSPANRADVYKWLMYSVATLMPTFSIMRQHKELEAGVPAMLDVLDRQLGQTEFLAGSYSIADMTPVTRFALFTDHEWFKSRPNLNRWLTTVLARPAVKKALEMKIGE